LESIPGLRKRFTNTGFVRKGQRRLEASSLQYMYFSKSSTVLYKTSGLLFPIEREFETCKMGRHSSLTLLLTYDGEKLEVTCRKLTVKIKQLNSPIIICRYSAELGPNLPEIM